MSVAGQIVEALLENDEINPKDFVINNGLFAYPKIKTTFSTITWDDTGDPDGYEEKNGYEDEEGHEVEVDDFDREDGKDVADLATRWLWDHGVVEPSSSDFHPGVWYTSCEDRDMTTGAITTRSFHLEGFTPEEEQKIFTLLFKR